MASSTGHQVTQQSDPWEKKMNHMSLLNIDCYCLEHFQAINTGSEYLGTGKYRGNGAY